jgi:DNA polymerase-1
VATLGDNSTPKLFVVDAMGYIFRSYHAIARMTNPQGASTNALFGFVRQLMKLFKDFSPTHLVVVFDGPHNEKSRKDLYPLYKANRGETPSDLIPQFNWVTEFCHLKGLPTITLEGVEADDTMAAIASWAQEKGIHTYICSSDKDMAQIVNENVSILNVFKENLILDPMGVQTAYGIPPAQMGDYLAILGDTSDNVPGVPGIGPKGAQELIAAYGSIEGIRAHLDEIKGKRGETLKTNFDQLVLSRRLIALETNLPIPKDFSFYEVKSQETLGLKQFFQTHAFQSLLKDLEPEHKVTERKEADIVQTQEELDKLVKVLSAAPKICLDTETTSEFPHLAEAVGIGLGLSTNQIWYVPLNGSLAKETVIAALKPILEKKPLVGHNIKYDLHILHGLGIRPLAPAFDTMVASYLLRAEERQHNLDALSLLVFDHRKIPIHSLIGKGKGAITMAEVPIHQVASYCSEDIEMTLKLEEVFRDELERENLKKLYEEIELPLIPILADMEERGIYVDREVLGILNEKVKTKLQLLQTEIFSLVGEEFNLNSPKQLGEILFDKLQIPPPKKTKTGYSTSAEVLEELSEVHPMIPLILEYRTLEKLRSTYLETLPDQIHPRTGRVHCTFNQSVAATGRLSCQDPNLQNIPIRSPIGREIREAFRPEKKDWVFLSADYSQIELRLLAHFSQDPLLIEAFKSGDDVHKRTAATLFNVLPEWVTPEMRSRAKAVNFGIIYGQQAFGLSRELGIDTKEAEKFIRLYFEKYSKVKEYLQKSKDEAKATGFAKTMYGRVRKIPDINNPNGMIRQAAERLAINTPLQGSQADLIKAAMIVIDKRIKKENFKARLLLQIHDELIFELPEEEVPLFSALVKKEMEGILSLSIPLVVGMAVGKNWKDC